MVGGQQIREMRRPEQSVRSCCVPCILCSGPKEQPGFTANCFADCVAFEWRKFLFVFLVSQVLDRLHKEIRSRCVLEEEGLPCLGTTPSLRADAMNNRQQHLSFCCANGFVGRHLSRARSLNENVPWVFENPVRKLTIDCFERAFSRFYGDRQIFRAIAIEVTDSEVRFARCIWSCRFFEDSGDSVADLGWVGRRGLFACESRGRCRRGHREHAGSRFYRSCDPRRGFNAFGLLVSFGTAWH